MPVASAEWLQEKMLQPQLEEQRFCLTSLDSAGFKHCWKQAWRQPSSWHCALQGETLEQQFGEQEVCFRTLDLYTSAVLESTLNPVVQPKKEFRDAMEDMAKVLSGPVCLPNPTPSPEDCNGALVQTASCHSDKRGARQAWLGLQPSLLSCPSHWSMPMHESS